MNLGWNEYKKDNILIKICLDMRIYGYLVKK